MGKKFLIDTNVLIYYMNDSIPGHKIKMIIVGVFLNLVDAYGFEGALTEIDKANRHIALEYKKNPRKRINRVSSSPSSRSFTHFYIKN